MNWVWVNFIQINVCINLSNFFHSCYISWILSLAHHLLWFVSYRHNMQFVYDRICIIMRLLWKYSFSFHHTILSDSSGIVIWCVLQFFLRFTHLCKQINHFLQLALEFSFLKAFLILPWWILLWTNAYK